MPDSVASASAVRFRGRSLMALVLAPEPPLEQWLSDLDALLARSPAYFVNKPVVVDVSALPQKRPDLMGIVNELQARKIRVMALEGTDTGTLGADARGLPPIVTDGRPSTPIELPSADAANERPQAPPPPRLAALHGDRTADPFGPVDLLPGRRRHGARLRRVGRRDRRRRLDPHLRRARGRALAGWGNKAGRIFCQNLDAELLAVDGLYKTADEIDAGLRGRPVQAWTKDDVLMVEALT